MPYLWYSHAIIWKGYCRISNGHLQNCQNAKYYVQEWKVKFATKVVLLASFWAEIANKLLSYLKMALLNLSKFDKSFMLKGKKQIWDQNDPLLVFLDWNLKKLLSYLQLAQLNLSKWKVSFRTKKIWA